MVSKHLTKELSEELIDGVDTFLFDCDGVIWRGSHVVENVINVLTTLRGKGKRILFVTNNSTNSRATYAKKFAGLGIEASPEEIFGSAYAAAYYVKHILKFPEDKRVFVCGMDGIVDELAAEGVNTCGAAEDNENLPSMNAMGTVQHDPSIGAVLFGFDLNINYKKLAKAFTYLRSDPSIHFLATNSDLTFPAGDMIYPGTGALLSALSAPLGRQPVVLGKPTQNMLDVIIDKYKLDRARTCMVGDRLDTDIEFGKLGGLKTLLVLTGVTSVEEMKSSSIQADFFIESLGRLI
ncbi:HAD-like domain-containing protein [Cladochytrium replicatum]|nr:HAD-like domain-containing protein [Cladochytrium replicatum]